MTFSQKNMDYKEAYEELKQVHDDICNMFEIVISKCDHPKCDKTYIESHYAQKTLGNVVYVCAYCEDVHSCMEHFGKYLCEHDDDGEPVMVCKKCIAENIE